MLNKNRQLESFESDQHLTVLSSGKWTEQGVAFSVHNPASLTGPSGIASPSTATKETYRPAIDGLRTVAVLMVLYNHYWDSQGPTGHLGVRIFFVLSGFLITGILLDARKRVSREGWGPVYRTFMARRALRLLPAYYALIFLLLLVNVDNIRTVALWHLAHASNILFSIQNDYVSWVTAHLWSLSVEEQFYLVWPLLVLTVSAHWLKPMMLATISVGIGFRCIALMIDEPQLAHYYLPFASLDALGAGGLLALHLKTGGETRIIEMIGAACGGIVFVTLAIPTLAAAAGTTGEYIVLEAMAVPAMVALVAVAARSHCGIIGQALSTKPMVALGRISYGIYLYHYAVLAGILSASSALGFGFIDYGPVRFLLGTVLTIAIAALSWTFLERPFLALKRRVPY